MQHFASGIVKYCK